MATIYDHRMGLDICCDCGEYIIDGLCSCDVADESSEEVHLTEDESVRQQAVGRAMLQKVVAVDRRRHSESAGLRGPAEKEG